jgi:Glutaminase
MAVCAERATLTNTFTTYLHAAAECGRRAARDGVVSTQIPALAAVAPTKFAMAVACVDGTVVHTGDSDEAFSVRACPNCLRCACCFDTIALHGVRSDGPPQTAATVRWPISNTTTVARRTRSSTQAPSS